MYAVDETIETEAMEAELETPAFRPSLHDAPSPSPLTEEELREIRKRHLAFKQLGRSREVDVPPADGFVPLSLYPYLDVDRLRGDYPVCAFIDADVGIASLTQVVDRALDEVELEGDELERCRRWTYQLESLIRLRTSENDDRQLFKLWNTCSEELSNQYGDDPEKQKKLHDDLAAVRKNIPSDAKLIACDESTAPRILEALLRNGGQETDSSTQDIANVLQRLNDLLSLEFEQSDSGLAPDHLKESVGEAFQSDLDFDALSSMLHVAPHGESLSSDRQSRIETIIGILEGHLDGLRSRNQTIEHVSESDQLIQYARRLLQNESAVARAWLAARLETGNRFDEKRHAVLLAPDAPAGWSTFVLAPTPIPPIHIDLRDGFTASDVANLSEMFDRKLPARILVTVGNCIAGGATDESEPYLPTSLGERLISAGQALGFVCQRSLANVDGLLETMNAFLASEETAVMIVYDGAAFGSEGIHPYLKSAAGVESRVIPAFVTEAAKGDNWAQRFSVMDNEQPERIWSETNVEIGTEEAKRAGSSVFSAAALMLCDPTFSDHFGLLDRREWHDDLVPVDKYTGSPQHIPFVEAGSSDGAIHRVIVSDYVWSQMTGVAERWKSLRELGGIANSFATKAVNDEKARLEAEFQDRTKALEEQHHATLEASTGKLAEEIVANIAAGLLGEASTGAAPPRPRPAAPATTAGKVVEEDLAEPEPESEEPETEEEDLEVFDEAYVETPRCTACDECTTLNPRMFVYNENKQAYIADASAGTFRDLVMAAEKCPVRIIHPGKPLNPDEPHLDELVKRAEPFR